MNAVPKHGFDGEPPEFCAKRGSEVRDTLTGEIIRHGEPSPYNINVDRLSWLLAHKRISQVQHDAGERLQKLWRKAKMESYAVISGSGGGGAGRTRVADSVCDARDEVAAAHDHIGNSGWRVIELVVLQSASLGKAEGMMCLGPGGGIGALRVALDALARHLRMA